MRLPVVGVPGALLMPGRGTRLKGHAAAIQPIVPHNRTSPKSFFWSATLAKAIELVMEIVGT